MTLARSMTGASYPAIGKAFQRDHTTVMSAVQRSAVLMQRYPEFAEKVNAVAAAVREFQATNPLPCPMMDAFEAMIAKHRARMTALRAAVEQDGCLVAVSRRDPFYRLLLSRSTVSDAVWRVTSFRDREPVGYREYDVLDGRGPTQNALQEFAGQDMQVVRRRRGPCPSLPNPTH